MMFLVHAIVAVVACFLVLGGCSYRPLYGTATEDRGVVGELAAVTIPEADTRLGQLVRNDLLSAMRPGGQAGEERYRLDLTLNKTDSDVIDRSQPSVTRRSVRVSAAFILTDGSNEVYSGKTFSQVSYDVVRQPFADSQAEINAMERAAHELSGDIRTRLASYFATR